MTTGYDIVLRRSFESLSSDHRIQAVLIAFCFGALLEALAGFGIPVAVTAVMLIAVGLKPMKIAAVALVANTAPVAFGTIAVPITTLGRITGIDPRVLGAMVGCQSPILAVFVPFILVAMVDGVRSLRQTWPAALVGGLAFVVLLRVWQPLAAATGLIRKFRWTIVTVTSVLALAYLMNFSGQTVTLALAATGGFFGFLSPVVGWIGVAVTGSDTSANSLFGLLQVTAAQRTGISSVLLAAANTSGGVVGKMVSPQNLAIAVVVVGLDGPESDLLRSVAKWSLLLLLGVCVLVYLQSTPILRWMVAS
jgi:L-lactate permease